MINQWSNIDNNNFYEKLNANGLGEIAKVGGLARGADVLHCKEYWQNARNILDVGSGYGRVIDCLLENGYSGEIVSVERCETLCNALHAKYLANAKIQILKIDIHDILLVFSPLYTTKFDTILWMWSGIADFPPEEQSGIVCNLASLLKLNGTFIIDTMPAEITPVLGKEIASQCFTTTLNGATVHTYQPNESEIRAYAQEAGFSKIIKTSCFTDIGRKRSLYILKF